MMNLETLKSITRELDSLIIGGFINKIHQPLPRDICIRIRVRGEGERKLIMSADPQFGRIHLTDLRIPNPQIPPRFCQYLRAHLQGSVIREVLVANDDRIVILRCCKAVHGAAAARDLVLELLGRDSNILLVDSASTLVMDCLHQIPPTERTTRPIMPGMHYEPPPRRTYSIHSPKVHPESAFHAPAKRGMLLEDRLVSLESPPEAQDDRFSANLDADAKYSPCIESLITESFRRSHTVPLRKKLAGLNRRIVKIHHDRERLENYVSEQQKGELLKGNLNILKKGMRRIEIEDWNRDHKVSIELDPVLDGIGNMQRIFAKAAKGKRGIAVVHNRMEETLAEKMALENLLFLLQDARTIADIESITEGLETVSHTSRKQPKQRVRSADKSSGKGYRVSHSPSGFQILIGKTAAGNDFILRHRADVTDLWFHAKDVPGAHVVLRIPKGKLPADIDIDEAAALAGYFSQARPSGRTEIMMTHVKNVQRIKGRIPGCVKVASYTTMLAAWRNMQVTS